MHRRRDATKHLERGCASESAGADSGSGQSPGESASAPSARAAGFAGGDVEGHLDDGALVTGRGPRRAEDSPTGSAR